MAADVCDLVAMQAAVDRTVERFGGIDVVIANADIGSCGSVLQVAPQAFRRLMDVNVLAVLHTVRAALSSVIEWRGRWPHGNEVRPRRIKCPAWVGCCAGYGRLHPAGWGNAGAAVCAGTATAASCGAA